MPPPLFTALLALQLLAAPPPLPRPLAPVAAPAVPWDDEAGDLARLDRLALRLDLAVARRDAAMLRAVEARVREELGRQLRAIEVEQRPGTARRRHFLERAAHAFAEWEGRTDETTLDRKRAALADASQAAWAELVGVSAGDARWRQPRPDGRDERLEEPWERPPLPPAPRLHPMRPDRFASLAQTMQEEPFAQGKLRLLDTALAGPADGLTVEQAGQLLGQFTFASDKLDVLRRLRARLVNPQDAYQLYDRFTFDSEKEEARRILAP